MVETVLEALDSATGMELALLLLLLASAVLLVVVVDDAEGRPLFLPALALEALPAFEADDGGMSWAMLSVQIERCCVLSQCCCNRSSFLIFLKVASNEDDRETVGERTRRNDKIQKCLDSASSHTTTNTVTPSHRTLLSYSYTYRNNPDPLRTFCWASWKQESGRKPYI